MLSSNLTNNQRTNEWFEARLGKVTASNFDKIITSTGKKSTMWKSYLYQIIGEIVTGEARQATSTETNWGIENENEAKIEYELRGYGMVDDVGYVEISEGSLAERVGGSPDGLCSEKGIIEIKCPYNSIYHIKHICEGWVNPKYVSQIQGNLWITNREFCDYVTYDPRILDPKNILHVTRVLRDEEYIKKLEQYITEFISDLDNLLEKFNG